MSFIRRFLEVVGNFCVGLGVSYVVIAGVIFFAPGPLWTLTQLLASGIGWSQWATLFVVPIPLALLVGVFFAVPKGKEP